MIYILLLLLSLFLFGPLVFILLSFFIFRKKIRIYTSFSQIYDAVHSMMQRGEFNFQGFGQNYNKQSSSTGQEMSKAEALEMLGLNQGAKPEEINKSYHKLMQKIHPDKGGSEYFARKLNKAREILLR